MATQKTPKITKMARKPVVRLLACKLTEEELRDRGQKLAATRLEIDRLTVEVKVVASEFKDQLKGLGQESRRLAKAVKAGSEDRDVKCEQVLDFVDGTYSVQRLDTGECMDTRPLTDGERQLQIPGAVAPAKV